VEDAGTRGTATKSDISSNKETITLAMDWLCVHLTEPQLLHGFRPNKNTSKNHKNPLLSKSGIPLVGSNYIKAIPHPSISLATDIVSEKAWARSIRSQERILKFVRLGFSSEEATEACGETSFVDDDVMDTSLAKMSPIQDPALPVLLSLVRSNIMAEMDMQEPDTFDDTYFEYAAEERRNEREALEAIYDEQFQITTDVNTQLDKYLLQISPVGPLLEPARSEDCQLYVFLRPSYPVVESPLLWFSNSSMAPSLLRQINEFAAKQALDNVGAPTVFDIVSSLSDSLPDLQLEFIRLQRRQEFEAEQARLRKQRVGHMNEVERVVEAQYEGGKIGRRQRAKLKAVEKCYNRGDQQQQEEQERRKRQVERVQRAKQGNSRVRAVYAEQTLLRREEEKVRDETERAARMAMPSIVERALNKLEVLLTKRAYSVSRSTESVEEKKWTSCRKIPKR
jgi:hypothetical protein